MTMYLSSMGWSQLGDSDAEVEGTHIFRLLTECDGGSLMAASTESEAYNSQHNRALAYYA